MRGVVEVCEERRVCDASAREAGSFMAALLVVVCCCAVWRYLCPVALPPLLLWIGHSAKTCVFWHRTREYEELRGQYMYASFCLLEVLRGDRHCAGRRRVVWRAR